MKTMKIFEPAMCCPTGLCGVSVDPELLCVSTVLNTLKQHGIEVLRFNLTSAPMEFVNHPAVSDYLRKFGPDRLPVVLVEDCIVIAGRYPTNAEFASWLDVSPELLGVPSACCTGSACCCTDEQANAEAGCCCTDEQANAEAGCCCSDEQANAEAGCCCSDAEANAEAGCCCTDEQANAEAGCCCSGGCC